MATIVDGRAIARKILQELKAEVANLSFQPLFSDVLIGQDPVARSYVNIKLKRAEEIGLQFKLLELPDSVATQTVIDELQHIQDNPQLSGLIVQLPLPAQLDRISILNAIDPKVDVDYLNETNARLFYAGKSQTIPPTAAAILTILDSLGLDLKQLKILVVGQGDLVGRPITFLLSQRGYQVTTADQTTRSLGELTKRADMIISGTGKPKLINGDMIKLGATIIDAGTAESTGEFVGDVDLESVSAKAQIVSPVPGGVGPVTVAKLLFNVVKVAKGLKHV